MQNITINNISVKYEKHGKEIFIWDSFTNRDIDIIYKDLKLKYGKDTTITFFAKRIYDKDLSIAFNPKS